MLVMSFSYYMYMYNIQYMYVYMIDIYCKDETERLALQFGRAY